ncbi:hypothetical protein DAEQUDRAFT_660796 [Daedalea quercina L-15889]|uniref:Cytochrome P450 n=1 Tax=Daedalea quercina L-15889 TaxID=1314783 RepID=A0A165U104_9APHY|nr:hypothetical protein DAEQUDRAFT_660796 [Daedalea quercina L-15889]
MYPLVRSPPRARRFSVHRTSTTATRATSPHPERFCLEHSRLRKDHDAETLQLLHTNAYIPFSGGPADCVGHPLVLIETRIGLVCIMRAFDLRFRSGLDADD